MRSLTACESHSITLSLPFYFPELGEASVFHLILKYNIGGGGNKCKKKLPCGKDELDQKEGRTLIYA